jgi:hypothetical protein
MTLDLGLGPFEAAIVKAKTRHLQRRKGFTKAYFAERTGTIEAKDKGCEQILSFIIACRLIAPALRLLS